MCDDMKCGIKTDDSCTLFFGDSNRCHKMFIISATQFNTLVSMGVIQVFRGVKGNRIIKYNDEKCLKALQEQGIISKNGEI